MKLLELLISGVLYVDNMRSFKLWDIGWVNYGAGQDGLGHRGEWEDYFLYSTYDVRYPDKIVGIVLLDGSSNRLYYYVNYRLKDIVGDTWCDVNAKVYIEDTLIHSSYMYSYIGYHSTVPYGTVASSPMPSRIYNIVYL